MKATHSPPFLKKDCVITDDRMSIRANNTAGPGDRGF
jgi:hypothetical protein